MRGVAAWLLSLVVAFVTLPAVAEEASAPPGPQFTTMVEGAVPDLTGRWLVVAQIAVGQGDQQGLAVTVLWDVTTVEGKPQLAVRWAKLPAPLAQSLTTANEQHRAWEPSESELVQLRDAWSGLTPEDRGAKQVDTTLTGKDAFSDTAKADERMKDSQFLVQMVVLYAPGKGPIKDALLYGAMEPTPTGYRGNYASVTIAAAPFPVPIPFKGTFRMYRLDGLAPPGLLARVLGMFSGCGRTRDVAQ